MKNLVQIKSNVIDLQFEDDSPVAAINMKNLMIRSMKYRTKQCQSVNASQQQLSSFSYRLIASDNNVIDLQFENESGHHQSCLSKPLSPQGRCCLAWACLGRENGNYLAKIDFAKLKFAAYTLVV